MELIVTDGMRVGSNRISQVHIDVKPTAALLFVRHVHSLLRTFSSPSTTSSGAGEAERFYRVTFVTGPDSGIENVPIFLGWRMNQHEPVTEVWTAVGTEGELAIRTGLGNPSPADLEALERRLAELVGGAARLANSETLWPFDVAYRLDAGQPLCPHEPIDLGDTFVVTLPKEEDAMSKGWGHNPGLGVMLQTLATDSEDAIAAGAIPLYRRILFWTFLSLSFHWKTKALFSVRSNWNESKNGLVSLRLPTEAALDIQKYSRVDAKHALEQAKRLWDAAESTNNKLQRTLLTALAAFRTALEIQTRTQYSLALSIVAHIAALESICGPPQLCPGQLSCDLGHEVTFRHELAGHLQTVLHGVKAAIGGTKFCQAEKLLTRAYRKYRSAYVHSALTPLHEYEEKSAILDLQDSRRFWKGDEDAFLIFDLERLVRTVLEFKILSGNDL